MIPPAQERSALEGMLLRIEMEMLCERMSSRSERAAWELAMRESVNIRQAGGPKRRIQAYPVGARKHLDFVTYTQLV